MEKSKDLVKELAVIELIEELYESFCATYCYLTAYDNDDEFCVTSMPFQIENKDGKFDENTVTDILELVIEKNA